MRNVRQNLFDMAQWIAWTLATVFSWGIWAVLFRFIGSDLAPADTQVISTLGIIPVLCGIWLLRDSKQAGNRYLGIALAFGSGIFSCLGNVACYEALNHAKAAAVIPLTALYPVVTILLAIPLLKERVTLFQLSGICVSLAAIWLFNFQDSSEEIPGIVSTWMLLPLAAVLMWGITGLMQKVATNHLSARSSAIWFLAAFFPVAGWILSYNPLPDGISAFTWLVALAMGFTLAFGNFTLLLAFSSGGKASIIVPLAGLYPLVSIPIAIFAFGERLTTRETMGIILALVAVVMLSYQPEPDRSSAPPAERDTPA
jgi:transporter family protein